MLGWIVTTYGERDTNKTLKSIFPDPVIVYNASQFDSLAATWNQAIKDYIDTFEVMIITQDDVEVEEDTAGDLLDAVDFLDMATAWDYNVPSTKDYFGAFCFTMTKKLWDKIGPFDEGFKGFFYEDTDYMYRMNLANCLFRAVTPVWHQGGVSARELTPKEKEIRDTNAVRYFIKWGGNVEQEKYTVPFNGKSEEQALEDFNNAAF